MVLLTVPTRPLMVLRWPLTWCTLLCGMQLTRLYLLRTPVSLRWVPPVLVLAPIGIRVLVPISRVLPVVRPLPLEEPTRL